MDIETVLREYIDRCNQVLEKKQQISEEHSFSEPESGRRDYLEYVRSINSLRKELLADFLDGLSYSNLKLLLAIFYCSKDQFDFPDDVSTLKKPKVKKKKIINTLKEKDPEVVVSHLEKALEKLEQENIDLNK